MIFLGQISDNKEGESWTEIYIVLNFLILILVMISLIEFKRKKKEFETENLKE
jgi:hypothetical protein